MNLSLNYLKQIASLLGLSVENISSSAGYDAMISLVSASRVETFPKVIIEDITSGYFSAVPGGMDVATLSIWIMDRAPAGKNEEHFNKMKELTKKLVSLLIRDCESLSIDIERIPYYARMGGLNNVGYEIMVTAKNNIDLVYGL